MAKMCPLGGRGTRPGLCVHDWMMIVMGGMGAALAVANWGLHGFSSSVPRMDSLVANWMISLLGAIVLAQGIGKALDVRGYVAAGP